MWKLNYNQLLWSEVFYNSNGSAPDIRQGHAAMFYSGLLYVYGGIQGTKTFCDLWRFDPSDSSWTQITLSTTICRGYSAYAPTNNSLVLFGGLDETSSVVNSLIRIDVLTGKVYAYLNVYFPYSGILQNGLIQSMMTITSSGDLYLFGGDDGNNRKSGTLYKFIFGKETCL